MEAIERALVVTAHPDDVDFGASGTVAGWTDDGVVVTYCIVTDGDAGGFDPAVPRADIPGIRRAEQVAAAAAVGVDDVRFLGYPDGQLVASLDLRRDLSRVIRQVRPDLVVCQSPERNWASVFASHPDHRAAGDATLDAVYPDARNPFAHPSLLADEGLDAHIVHEVWIMGGPRPDHVVDVTDRLDRKTAALRAHASQMTDPSGDPPPIMREMMARNAARGGLSEGRLAEAFQVLRIP